MNKFNLYVMRSFLRNLITVLLFIMLLQALSSAYGNINIISGYEYSAIDFGVLAIYGVILGINQLMPIVAAVSVIMTILLLMRSNELLAYMTIGGSIVRLAVPFVLIGMLLSTTMLLLEYKIMPSTRDKRETLLNDIRNVQRTERITGFYDTWFVGNDKNIDITNIGLVSISDKKIYNVREYRTNDAGEIVKLIYSKMIEKTKNGWTAHDVTITDISKNPPEEVFYESISIHEKLWDRLVNLSTTNPKAFTPTELVTMINLLEEKGVSTSEYKMMLYFKIASAISVIVLILFMFPLAVNFSRNYSIMKNAAITFSLALVFIVTQYVGKSLGDAGALSPFMATFGHICLFLIISIYLMYERGKAR